jgi:hypothetical protein
MLTALATLTSNPGAYNPPTDDRLHTIGIPILLIVLGLILAIVGAMRWSDGGGFVSGGVAVIGVIVVAVALFSTLQNVWMGTPADRYRTSYVTHTQQWLRTDFDITANREQVSALVDGKPLIAETSQGDREIHLTPDTNGHLVVVLRGGEILRPVTH